MCFENEYLKMQFLGVEKECAPRRMHFCIANKTNTTYQLSAVFPANPKFSGGKPLVLQGQAMFNDAVLEIAAYSDAFEKQSFRFGLSGGMFVDDPEYSSKYDSWISADDPDIPPPSEKIWKSLFFEECVIPVVPYKG